ncbi:MAG: hypothetical protein ACI9CA_001759, partial [Natronomonas sp.]
GRQKPAVLGNLKAHERTRVAVTCAFFGSSR